jgi:hypothetical protein
MRTVQIPGACSEKNILFVDHLCPWSASDVFVDADFSSNISSQGYPLSRRVRMTKNVIIESSKTSSVTMCVQERARGLARSKKNLP